MYNYIKINITIVTDDIKTTLFKSKLAIQRFEIILMIQEV